ncbi:uncharacterized protein LOC120336828 [Styela clava]|uniref:protein FAM177A1-like n=1 Tax=Styela clava TaxID=7725 RepID=UPI00193AB6DA|nr:protein FAM177A1-like [Styela clava]
MAGIENQAFSDQSVPETSEDKPAILDVTKEGHFKINKAGKVKVPRRVLHCSDGVYEEYSTDEEEDEAELQPVVDPKTLKWAPYLWYWTTRSAVKSLAVCDYLGEKLAWFFGITSPRYQYALDELERMKQEEKEQEEMEKEEREAELDFVKTSESKLQSHPPKQINYGTSQSVSTPLDVSDVKLTSNEEGDR